MILAGFLFQPENGNEYRGVGGSISILFYNVLFEFKHGELVAVCMANMFVYL